MLSKEYRDKGARAFLLAYINTNGPLQSRMVQDAPQEGHPPSLDQSETSNTMLALEALSGRESSAGSLGGDPWELQPPRPQPPQEPQAWNRRRPVINEEAPLPAPQVERIPAEQPMPAAEPMSPFRSGFLPYGDKYRVYFTGLKQQLNCNVIPQPEMEKLPVFITEPKPAKLATLRRRATVCDRRKLLKRFAADRDLTYHLKLESAFMPRSQQLLLQLKQKAKRWWANWDTSALSSQEIYEQTMAAIGQAMLVDQWEEDTRALLHIPDEREFVRPLANSFLAEGRTGVSPSACLSHSRVRVSAWRRWVYRPLTRVIAF